MKLAEWLKVKKTLWIMAMTKGCTIAEARQSIQECIDEAWNYTWTPGNLVAQVRWQQMFPGGKKPTVEQFIIAMARKVTEESVVRCTQNEAW